LQWLLASEVGVVAEAAKLNSSSLHKDEVIGIRLENQDSNGVLETTVESHG